MLRKCVVCGCGSHRDDWIRVSADGKFVACDNHDVITFDEACARATNEVVNNKPVAAPQAPEPPSATPAAAKLPAPAANAAAVGKPGVFKHVPVFGKK